MIRFLRHVLAGSRYLIVVAVFGSFVAAAAAFVFGGLATVQLVLQTFGGGDYSQHGAKRLAVGLVEMIDLFLLGTVLYIVAAGLYQLFLDPSLPLPPWLRITSLEDLKERLLGAIIVLLAVAFLGDLVEWDGTWSLLAEGVAVGLVLGVLALSIAVLARSHPPEHAGPPGADPPARQSGLPAPAGGEPPPHGDTRPPTQPPPTPH